MRIILLSILCITLGCNTPEKENSESSETSDKVNQKQEEKITPEVIMTEDKMVDQVKDTQSVSIEYPEELDSEVAGESSNEYSDIDWDDYEASMKQDYSYVILISTKSYEAALERANEAAEKLGYPLNLRELSPNDEIGLTLPVEVCESICGGDVGIEFPQYLPRDNYGDTKYVSVEFSDGYEGFTKGYYIVIAASGAKGDMELDEALIECKAQYEDAYAKTCGVWMGCGC